MPELIDTVCTSCWGKRYETIERGKVGEVIQCRRCRGTGEEPDSFNWTVITLCIVIAVAGLYFVWSVK